ncbi:extracellular calcium-sensing receptor-like [Spea bombifrons]|uniref:extracellular calcium-sensing receptor-like n=1 Tax=Spea bombifrons TaxID=233779 RepID=UPI00234B676C|nr:extracellular calcium-sensing receptor-like [Spea bombifrons]
MLYKWPVLILNSEIIISQQQKPCHCTRDSMRYAFYSKDQLCRLPISELEGMSRPGDIMIGVLLLLHLDNVYRPVPFTERPPRLECALFHQDSYQQLQAFIFAVEEINRNPEILPNITLGFQAYDSCVMLQQSVEGAFQVLTGTGRGIPNYRCLGDVPLSSLIGHAASTHSILLAHILGLYKYPQISHFSTSPLLSNRKKFPSFFRTVPSDTFQSQGIAQLVLYFGWTWVGLLGVDNDYGQQGIQLVKQEIVKAGACVAFTENIVKQKPDRNAPHIVKVMRDSAAMVVVVFSSDVDLVPILDEMLIRNIPRKIFVASEAWSTSNVFHMGKYSRLLYGTIGLALPGGAIPELKEFLNKVHPSMSVGGNWARLLWEKSFSCKIPDGKNLTGSLKNPVKWCTGDESLENIQNNYNDVSRLRVTYNMYTAVHVVAKSLEDLRSCDKEEFPFFHRKCADIRNFRPWQLLHYMKKVRVTLSSGRELYFDENGDPPANYDIVNWQPGPNSTVRHVKVGSYDTTASLGQVFTINTSAILWAAGDKQVPISVCSQSCLPGFRKATKRGEPVCCFQCVPCPQGEISNRTDSVGCSKCPWDHWPNAQKSLCLPKTLEYLSYEDTLGSTLAAVSISSSLVPDFILRLFVQHKVSPIVKANNYSVSCILLISLSLCFLCSLAFIGYPQPHTCLLRQTAFGMVFALCISCVLAKTVMVVCAFMATKPGSSLRKWTNPRVSYMIILTCSFLQLLLSILWLSLAPPFPEQDLQTQPKIILVMCNEGHPAAFWCMLGYLGLLASISFIFAFLARRLPDSFNEAKFITFSMLAFLSVWVSYIPASLSAQGRYTVAMEIFAIVSSSWALVICMFAPKCFIILFRPNMNSREHLRQK